MTSLLKPLGGRDAVLLVARVLIGAIFLAHGWQKFTEWGLDGTGAAFEQMGVPAPGIAATLAAVIELVGGIALILGALTTVFSVLLVLDMVGAAVLVHIGNGVFVTENGWELVAALAAGALVLAATGAGAYSVDRALTPRSQGRVADRQRERALVG
ncbi:DoxX family protein [Intrasporangium calvum]|uniref:DoxX family protein n=1 Tax=Intrasporangium calvum TaxID=53358 RepID=A0ABT5GEC8_9MICO|nr:DoxX family protein [Intrasporangium calvum]MDC5696160.1 DoxX family protein [Intrasporangium calvum]